MVKYRMATPNERDECIDLANYAFRLDFETLMPKAYGKNIDSSAMHKVAVDEKGRLRAQVAVFPAPLTVGDHTLQAGYLGTVSVHPRARGEGHMKALMDMWLEELSNTCDMVVLYGQRQRYEYFGFTLGGVKFKYFVGEANVRHGLKHINDTGISFCPLFEIEGAESFAHNMNTSRLAYIERNVQQLPVIFKTLHQNALGVLDKGKLIGYLIVNEAGDEISEFAMANADDISRTIKAYRAYSGAERITIYTPEYDIPLNRTLGSIAEDYVIETSDMYHILDFANVLEAYLTLKYKTTGLVQGEFSAVMDGQPITVRVDVSGVTVERSAKPDAVVLNKQQAQALLLTQHSRYMAVTVPVGWFPLPIFWYKVDKF
ncbi:GNAT family N-acetyltransferase [Paenibacillus sp. 19GGS1-52]|uniref:GNAT family N-acetyltransferase n=1 Tax=Paenibacillus sp. 19GGS1-52 TaxID=2758563 RepID=UPI001EFA2B69|nr:GNAT family N-acetyltransferase [Paenibacillus sp. 19GGS1-52]ULO07646.1 GNAT family N-acetyltransferase [Paenibacillus sp. 19GGS1-52]